MEPRVGTPFHILEEIWKGLVEDPDLLGLISRYKNHRVEMSQGGQYEGCGNTKDC